MRNSIFKVLKEERIYCHYYNIFRQNLEEFITKKTFTKYISKGGTLGKRSQKEGIRFKNEY